MLLRVGAGVVILLIVLGLVEALVTLKIPQTSFVLTEFVQVLEAALSAVVYTRQVD